MRAVRLFDVALPLCVYHIPPSTVYSRVLYNPTLLHIPKASLILQLVTMHSTTAAKRGKEKIATSRYVHQHTKPSDDKENSAQSQPQHTMTKLSPSSTTTTAPPSTLPASKTATPPLAKPGVVHSSRAALSTLPVSTNGPKPATVAPSSLNTSHPSRHSTSAAGKPDMQPPSSRRRTHGIADHPPISVSSHRSSLTLSRSTVPESASQPVTVRPQLSDLNLHCHQTALLQSLYWQEAVERAHNERREAAERQLGAVAAVLRSRLSEERECQQRIARIRQSESDHFSLAAQHAAITPLLPLIQQAATAHEQLCDVADTLKAQLRLDGVAVDVDELRAEIVEAQSVLHEIDELLHTECGAPSLASSLAALPPSLSALSVMLAECAPALSGTSSDLARLQDGVERESSVSLAQLAGSGEVERQQRRQEAGGKWQW